MYYLQIFSIWNISQGFVNMLIIRLLNSLVFFWSVNQSCFSKGYLTFPKTKQPSHRLGKTFHMKGTGHFKTSSVQGEEEIKRLRDFVLVLD